MKVNEVMSRDVRLASPDHTIRAAAQMMADVDAGIVPVGKNDRLVGMLTDRDIAVRAVAGGKGPNTRVREVMSQEVCYCFDDQELSEVAATMADNKIRRLPVVDRNKRLVGIVALADIALADGPSGNGGEVLCAVSEPGGEHSQTT